MKINFAKPESQWGKSLISSYGKPQKILWLKFTDREAADIHQQDEIFYTFSP